MRRISQYQRNRSGLTLVELLFAVSIISLTALALAMLSRAVQVSAAYTQGFCYSAQHARVSLERIQNAIFNATANESFPGAAVFADSVSGYRFPDTLVVWKPDTTAVDAAGLPRFSEITVYCPNPSTPTQFLEITSRSDTRVTPPVSNTSQWATELTTLKTGNSSRKVILTDMLRTANVDSTSGLRGCVRFELDLRPTAADLAGYRSGTTAWNAVLWPQGWYGQTTAMRQTWVRAELQLMPNSLAGGAANTSLAIPFFGSAALYYEITK